jgi:hypothetical protein
MRPESGLSSSIGRELLVPAFHSGDRGSGGVQSEGDRERTMWGGRGAVIPGLRGFLRPWLGIHRGVPARSAPGTLRTVRGARPWGGRDRTGVSGSPLADGRGAGSGSGLSDGAGSGTRRRDRRGRADPMVFGIGPGHGRWVRRTLDLHRSRRPGSASPGSPRASGFTPTSGAGVSLPPQPPEDVKKREDHHSEHRSLQLAAWGIPPGSFGTPPRSLQDWFPPVRRVPSPVSPPFPGHHPDGA